MTAQTQAPGRQAEQLGIPGEAILGADFAALSETERLARRHHAGRAPVAALTGWLAVPGPGAGLGPGPGRGPQKKFAYGTGRRFGGWGSLVQCDSIHRTRGSGPGGDTGSTNART